MGFEAKRVLSLLVRVVCWHVFQRGYKNCPFPGYVCADGGEVVQANPREDNV